MNIAIALDDCLNRLERGASVADCLARYADQAAELAPMLAAAGQLRSLATHELTAAQRLAGTAALRRALAAPARPTPAASRDWLNGLGWYLRRPALAAVAALCLFVVLAAGAVAASQPGDLAYGVRVVIERAPTFVILDSGARATAELELAERRLADVQSALQRRQQADPRSLTALIRSNEAAADSADRLTAAERRQLAARIEAHVGRLAQLAETATDPTAAQSLSQAASQARSIVERLRKTAPDGAGPIEAPPQPITPTLLPAPPTETPDAIDATPSATAIGAQATPTVTALPTRAPAERTREIETPRGPSAAATRAAWATEAAATAAARPPQTASTPVVTRLASPPPIVATRQAEHTADPPRPTAEPPRPTAEPPRPTDKPGGPPPVTPRPQPEPHPTRRR